MADVTIANTSTNLTAKTVLAAENDNTITGQLTYSRNPSAPFVVTASSASVTNLDADLVDGEHAATLHAGASLTGTIASGVQDNITRTGTIVSGVWNGTPVTVPNGGTGATSLTAHGVVLGEGTAAVAVTSTGTSGQVLTSNGASADPTFQTNSSACIRLGGGSVSQAVVAGVPFNKATVAISGLTIKDRILVTWSCSSGVSLNATEIRNTTDDVVCSGQTNGAQSGMLLLSAPTSTTAIQGIGLVNATPFGTAPAFTTAWTGSWSIGIHDETVVTLTQTLTWTVYKLVG